MKNMRKGTKMDGKDLLKSGDSKLYVKKSHTLEDARSTASTFTVMGVIGIVAVILVSLNVIELPMKGFSKGMFCVVMGGLFSFFTAVGIHSFFQIGKLKGETAAEEALTDTIKKWFLESYTKEQLDTMAGITDEDSTQEQFYFPRSEKIKELITDSYPKLEESYLDELMEEIYENIF